MKKLFAITGNPVLQSQSPVLFSAAYPSRADEFAYVRMAAQSAAEAMQLFAELGMSAMNVTAPFKGAVAQLADECAPEVQALKATNAVVRGEDGKTRCYNTDVAGVLGCLRDSGVALPGKRCLVLGAGGAGSAAAYALSTAGADVLVANRTIEKAQRLADNLGCRWCSLADIAELAPQVDMIVNTLYAQVDVVETAWLSPRHIVFDAIYHASLLREKARQAGCTFVDGEGWLLHQGLPAYRLFTGIEPEEASMRRMRRASFAPSLHVSLVGFMGVGKSTVAPLLAALLERPVADTDAEVERRCGLPVPRLIAEKGEAYFREQERTVVEALLGSPTPSVIACGGGAAAQPAVSELLRERSLAVWLYALPQACVGRIDVQTRPLLSRCEDPQQAAAAVAEQRKFMYAKTAHLLVNATHRSAAQVSQLIYDEISTTIPR